MQTEDVPTTPVTPSMTVEIDDEFVRASLASGMDLREYSDKVENELRSAHRHAVKDCIAQAEKLADLHVKIVDCEQTFAVSFKTQILYARLVLSGHRNHAINLSLRTWHSRHRYETATRTISSHQSATPQSSTSPRRVESVCRRYGGSTYYDKRYS